MKFCFVVLGFCKIIVRSELLKIDKVLMLHFISHSDGILSLKCWSTAIMRSPKTILIRPLYFMPSKIYVSEIEKEKPPKINFGLHSRTYTHAGLTRGEDC